VAQSLHGRYNLSRAAYNMISRIWLFACIALGQGLGFLTLTPPDEAFDNLRKWWTLLSRASGIGEVP
jgi:hypothetical protein